jgi:hypothetical protein
VDGFGYGQWERSDDYDEWSSPSPVRGGESENESDTESECATDDDGPLDG